MLNTTLFDIAYDARLSIGTTPGLGNLSNLVNQKMRLKHSVSRSFFRTEAGVLD
ncbi:MAG: hypothetical protein CM15mP79_1270 [Methanobacteriota archaeon]|nr:MAG: hypothetical protein CM15mP79_1270 [Euryarchaeota archaeon]